MLSPLARFTPKHVLVQAVLKLRMGLAPIITLPHTGRFECVLVQFMPCRLELLCDCTQAHLLIVPAEALRHIAVIVAVTLPQVQVHLQPMSSVYSHEHACFFAG